MKRFASLLFLGVVALFASCSDKGGGELKPNEAPTVWLSAGPPEGSTSQYRVEMFWGGWDPDGEIAGYEYKVSDNKTGVFDPADTTGVPWMPVLGNDSTFTFSADQAVDTLNASQMVAAFTRSHTFFIRSIDNEGLRSPVPAYRSFTSRTLSPEITIDVPVKHAQDPALVPPIATFRWHAKDWVNDMVVSQDPESVQFALVNTVGDFPNSGVNKFESAVAYLRTQAGQKEWHPWVFYRAPEDSGRFWTTPPVDLGTYVFAVRAKDEAGAITPVLDENRNWRRVKVAARNAGPLMTVTNDYIGVIRTVSCATPVTFLDSPAGVELEFRVTSDASSYGGEEAGYRYGWDIPDVNDPEQWEIDVTPFLDPTTNNALIPARAFNFGVHTLTIEVVDNSGYCSRVEVKVNIVKFTLERSVLVIDDDTGDDTGTAGLAQGSYPNDAEHDAFWLQMVGDVAGFDPEIDMINTQLDIPLIKLAQYKSIIWNVYSDVSNTQPVMRLYEYIKHKQKNPPPGSTGGGGKVKPNILALAMAAGGHIMVAGRHPIQLVVNRATDDKGVKWPLIFAYELEGDQTNPPPQTDDPLIGDLSFAYRELCLETLDYALMLPERLRKSRYPGGKVGYCPVEFVRKQTGASDLNDTMREGIPFDTHFQTIAIRSELTAPGAFYDPATRGFDVEVYNPEYFRRNSGKPGACDYVPPETRPCFEPIYLNGSLDPAEGVYHQPVAFWTSAYANRVADVAGAVGARSVVFGFPPVIIDPSEFKPAMDYILFTEWKLPRGSNLSAATAAE